MRLVCYIVHSPPWLGCNNQIINQSISTWCFSITGVLHAYMFYTYILNDRECYVMWLYGYLKLSVHLILGPPHESCKCGNCHPLWDRCFTVHLSIPHMHTSVVHRDFHVSNNPSRMSVNGQCFQTRRESHCYGYHEPSLQLGGGGGARVFEGKLNKHRHTHNYSVGISHTYI